MRFIASGTEVRRCGRPTLSGEVCPFDGLVRVDQIDDGPAMWVCPDCRRTHYRDAGRIETLDEVAW